MDLASGIAGLTSLTLELTTITYHYISDVRNAPEESKQFHGELHSLKTNLEELQKFLVAQDAQQIPFTKTSALVVSTNVCKDDLQYLKGKLVDFERVYEKRKWFKRLAWPFQREEHTQVLRRIKDYTQAFHFSLSLEGCSLLARTSKEIDEIYKQQRDSSRNVLEISLILGRLDTTIKCSIDHQFEEIRRTLGNHERKQLLNWLSQVDPSRNHNVATETKEPETGEWFIKSETFAQWIESAGSIWLYGIPGCGKTVLCSSIIESVQDLCRASGRCKSAYFYFSFQSAAEQNLNVVLGSILRQLSATEAPVPSAVQKLYDTHYEIGHSPGTKDLKDALIDTIAELGKEVYIMLDALDEVLDKKERNRTLEHFATLASLRLTNLHFLATSRDEWDIRQRLESVSDSKIRVEGRLVDADIRKYVGSSLQDLSEIPRYMKPAIQDRVSTEAHGMFRWAACQIETIRECRTIAEIEEALDDLPETLDDTYERVLQAIWKIDAEKGRAILTWLLFSERPLTLHEMAEAAVLRPGDTKLNPRDRLTQLSGVLSICRSLIILSNEMTGFPGSIYEGHVVQYVRFAHFSVKEYLTSGRSKVFTGLPITSHEYIGKCCISMLLPIDRVDSPYKNMENLLRDQFLLCYAAGSWFFHIKQLEALDKVPAELSSGVRKLLDHGSETQNYHAWMQIYDSTISELTPKRSRVDDLRRSSLPPLFYACRLGLMGETVRCIEARSDIVNQDLPEWGTPLHVASIQENYKITEILLRNKADAKLLDKWGRTAFGVAAIFGHEDNRRFLLDHGININDELNDALKNGGLRTIRFLLEHGAYGKHALRFAVQDGYFDLVQLILETSTDLNTEDYACALFVAARDNYPKTFKLVLDRVTSIRAIGAGCHILLAAVHGGSLEIISRLVKSGADINAPGGIAIEVPRTCFHTVYATALQYAVYRSNHDMTNYLLENGAEVNSRGYSLGTELQAAIRGHVDREFQGLHSVEITLGLLLENGADVNQQVRTRSREIPFSPRSRKKGTALQQAAAGGLDSVARLLVEKGADVNAQHNHCGTALMCASRHAKPRTLQVLVDMKADVNARVAGLGSALSEAARWGRFRNVQFLVENGADVNAEVEGVGTALLTALLYGQSRTAAVLIEAGADFHAAVWQMSIALSTASEDEGKEIGKLCFAICHPYPKLKAWDNWDNWFLECKWRERKPNCIL